MEQRFRGLRVVGTLYILAAVLVALAGVVVGVLLMTTPSFQGFDTDAAGNYVVRTGPPLVGAGVGVLVGGILIAITLYAISNFIGLMLAVEENTREAAEAMTKLANRSSKPRESSTDLPKVGNPLLRS